MLKKENSYGKNQSESNVGFTLDGKGKSGLLVVYRNGRRDWEGSMREILFRGKCKDTGRWYEGYYMHLHETTYCIKEDYDANPDNDIHQIVFEQMTDWGLPNKHYRVDVIPKTVGQFTGRTDKNGKRIFEGDIVAFYFFDKGTKNTRTMLIEWIESGFCMKELFRDYRLAKDFSIITEKIDTYRGEIKQGVYISNNTYFVEIIGNIHDNPELLEVKND